MHEHGVSPCSNHRHLSLKIVQFSSCFATLQQVLTSVSNLQIVANELIQTFYLTIQHTVMNKKNYLKSNFHQTSKIYFQIFTCLAHFLQCKSFLMNRSIVSRNYLPFPPTRKLPNLHLLFEELHCEENDEPFIT